MSLTEFIGKKLYEHTNLMIHLELDYFFFVAESIVHGGNKLEKI